MADTRISELSAAASLSGTEVLPLVQSAATVKTTAQDIANLAPVTSVAGKTGVVTLSSTDVGISSASISTWNTAYGWGNHATAGYSTFSGSYADLTNKPTIPADVSDLTDTTSLLVHFSGSYNDLSDKPTLFDGAYSSLSGTPSIPSALTDLGITDGTSGQVLTTNGAGSFTFTTVTSGEGGGIALTDLSVSVAAAGSANLTYNSSTGVFTYTPPDLSGYSTFSGSYTDLTNKPTLFSGSYTDLTNKPTLFDGAYSSLTGTPTIPSALTDLSITDGSSGQVLTTDGAGSFSFTTVSGGGGSGAAAWVNWKGDGVVAINDSYNVSSVTDLAVGTYLINFTTALPSSYPAIGTFSWDPVMGSGNDLYQLMGHQDYPPTSTSCGVYSKKDDGGTVDVEQNMMIFSV